MLTVGPTLATGIALLQSVAAQPTRTAETAQVVQEQAPPRLSSASRTGLSAAVADAVLRLKEIPTAAQAKAGIATGIPVDRVTWLKSLGADAWVVREPPVMADAQFNHQVRDSLVKSGSAKLAGFTEANENGSLKIQRAEEMPELGYKSYQVTLYKSGSVIGGVGFSTINADYRESLRESGIYAATGSVEGNDYVATWAMPPNAEDAYKQLVAFLAA